MKDEPMYEGDARLFDDMSVAARLGYPPLGTGGWNVKTTPYGDVRLIPHARGYVVAAGTTRLAPPNRLWLYNGSNRAAFWRAIAAVTQWDGTPGTSPHGWYRAIHDNAVQREHNYASERTDYTAAA